MKAYITNLINGREYFGEFEIQELLDAWIAKQETKESWGKREYTELKLEQSHENPRAEFIEEITQEQTILNENGEEVTEEITLYKYRIPQEYNITKDETPIDKAPIFFEELRTARQKVLDKTDWTQIADAQLTTDERTKYREYRQYLRDLPTQYNNSSVYNWNLKTFEEWKTFKGYNL